MSELDEYKKVKELESALDKAKNDISLKRLSIEKKENIPKLKTQLSLSFDTLENTGSNVRYVLRKFGKKFPSLVGKIFKEIADLRITYYKEKEKEIKNNNYYLFLDKT